MKFKKGDLLIFIIILIAGLGWFIQDYIWPESEKKVAIIEIDGEIYKKIQLNNKEQEEILIDLPKGNYIHVIIDDERIYVEDASCPDKLCKKTGIISRIGQNIVCLPNKVVIYIKGSSENNVDDISY